jgi:hypothetical protein
MNKSGFSYVKLTAVAAVLAMTFIGLGGRASVKTMAQDQDNETSTREVDLREKLKDKKFTDGRRVEIHSLSTGEKITAEVKDGKFVNLFLTRADGTEVKGVIKKDSKGNSVKDVCTATTTTTTTERKGLRKVTVITITTVEFPCNLALPTL